MCRMFLANLLGALLYRSRTETSCCRGSPMKTVIKMSKIIQTNRDRGISLDKMLGATLDSFDNLFCRRCLIFYCRLHGCTQRVIYPNEKQPYLYEHGDDWTPCSDLCYLHLRTAKKSTRGSALGTIYRRKSKNSQGKEKVAASFTAEELVPDIIPDDASHSGNEAPCTLHIPGTDIKTSVTAAHHLDFIGNHKDVEEKITSIDDPDITTGEGSPGYPRKRLKKYSSGEVELQKCTHIGIGKHPSEELECPVEVFSDKSEDVVMNGANERNYLPDEASNCSGSQDTVRDEAEVHVELPKLRQLPITRQGQGTPCSSLWKPIEKELYLKGVQIFGRNSLWDDFQHFQIHSSLKRQ